MSGTPALAILATNTSGSTLSDDVLTVSTKLAAA